MQTSTVQLKQFLCHQIAHTLHVIYSNDVHDLYPQTARRTLTAEPGPIFWGGPGLHVGIPNAPIVKRVKLKKPQQSEAVQEL